MARRERAAGGHANRREVPRGDVGTRLPGRVRGQVGGVYASERAGRCRRAAGDRAGSAGRPDGLVSVAENRHSVRPEHVAEPAQDRVRP